MEQLPLHRQCQLLHRRQITASSAVHWRPSMADDKNIPTDRKMRQIPICGRSTPCICRTTAAPPQRLRARPRKKVKQDSNGNGETDNF
jgi:hypothetical protein